MGQRDEKGNRHKAGKEERKRERRDGKGRRREEEKSVMWSSIKVYR